MKEAEILYFLVNLGVKEGGREKRRKDILLSAL